MTDDGCNKDLVSTRLFNQNRQHFNLVKKECIARHSKEYLKETSSKVVPNGALKIGSHTYATGWVVSDCKYDVFWEFLGMLKKTEHSII